MRLRTSLVLVLMIFLVLCYTYIIQGYKWNIFSLRTQLYLSYFPKSETDIASFVNGTKSNYKCNKTINGQLAKYPFCMNANIGVIL